MSRTTVTIPVILFAYGRPVHLARALACLRENGVPLIHAFADGAKGTADATAVAETRALLHAVDWCEMRVVEREENLGLGRSVLAGVSEVAARHDAFMVWEDDLICVPGTYAWMGAALRHYANDSRVMSVTGWTHPRVRPADVGDGPYFDARAECWVWGAWARSWQGMNEETAWKKMLSAERRGVRRAAYGADLPKMARTAQSKNLWAVRWLYHHFQHDGLCLRPPWSMVEHRGFDAMATNAPASGGWENPRLCPAPAPADEWPEPREASRLPSPVARGQSRWLGSPLAADTCQTFGCMKSLLRRFACDWTPPMLRRLVRRMRSRCGFSGDYASWAEAHAASAGYDVPAILEKTMVAARAVRDGRAAWERDSVTFAEPAAHWPLLACLLCAATAAGGRLHILDFGGAFGSAWWQHRSWLDGIEVKWAVVEQPRLVEAGRREFANGTLQFFETMDAACEGGQPTVLLLSSVLPYIEAPHAMLTDVTRRGFRHIIIDRTGFVAGERDRLTRQRVPPAIYDASYPCWFFLGLECCTTLPTITGWLQNGRALTRPASRRSFAGFS